jgi:hypothetical protein
MFVYAQRLPTTTIGVVELFGGKLKTLPPKNINNINNCSLGLGTQKIKIMKKIILALVLISTTFLSHSQIPTDSLVGYWPFNKNALDESGNNNDGVNSGAVITTDRFGNDSSAYYFNSADYINVDASSFPSSLNKGHTFSAWFKPDSNISTSGWRTLLFIGQNTQNDGIHIGYRHEAEGEYRIHYGTYGDELDSTKNGKLFNQWNHIVASYDSLSRKIYLNGEFFGIDSFSSLNITNMAMKIGRREDSFLGSLDDIRVYSRALDSTEIMSLYNEEEPCICTDTVFTTVYDTVTIEDTVIVNDTVWHDVYDTTYVDVYDTIYVNIYDTIAVEDTLNVDIVITELTPPNNTNEIKIYPNPTNEIVWIDCGDYTKMNNYTLKLIDALSVEKWSTTITQQLYDIDLTGYNTGIYFLEIFDSGNQKIEVKKIVLY